MPRGISLSIKSPSDITIHSRENFTIEGEIIISEKLDVLLKYLSFPTIISSLALRLFQDTTIIVSAGFNVSS